MYINPIKPYNYSSGKFNNNKPSNKNTIKTYPKLADKKVCCDQYMAQNIAFQSISSMPRAPLKAVVEPILNRNIIFGPEEYKNLSPLDLQKLRLYGKLFRYDDSETIDFITDFGKLFSKQIHEKYPEGFIFVSVGRSPAFLAKHLEFQGEQVMYCPISGLRTYYIDYSPEFLTVFKKYLDTIGLNKELVQTTDKPIIICDYTHEGCSLANFRKLLARPEFGIEEGEKVKYSPITWSVNDSFKKENSIFEDSPSLEDKYRPNRWDFDDNLYKEIMIWSKHKKYTSIPRINGRFFDIDKAAEVLDKFYQNNNKFEENFPTKMMNFLIADNIHLKSKLSNNLV